MKKLLLILFSVTLIGCVDGRVTLTQLQDADKVCVNNGGVKEVSFKGEPLGITEGMQGYTIFCNDDAEFSYFNKVTRLKNK